MIQQDYVSKAAASLLADAGFPQKADAATKVYVLNRGGEYVLVDNSGLTSPNIQRIVAPTLAQAMKWLREEHCHPIDIVSVPLDMRVDTHGVGHSTKFEYVVVHTQLPRFATYEGAADAAIVNISNLIIEGCK